MVPAAGLGLQCLDADGAAAGKMHDTVCRDATLDQGARSRREASAD